MKANATTKVGSDIACRWDGFGQYVSPYGSQEVPR